ncbi:hypothetical protein AVEN_58583-1 [Araneus ventricosus]|uniref:Uncharacterized protein n=1 Tax=Araneus ventricosus TaxID=182803 RepID=A0A4Y2GWM7_ARAVE|nr:hypothetical protein AVEN_58583-1 [Araneus ventricosus]
MQELENSSGKEQTMAVWSILKDWGLLEEAQILCSDANSSNIGRINSEIAFLKQYADREIAYFPAQHQMYEKVLRSVFGDEVTSSD